MLTNLSVVEILLFIVTLIDSVMWLYRQDDKYYLNTENIRELRLKVFPLVYDKVVLVFIVLTLSELVMSLILLNVDRLVCVLSPFRYYIAFTEKLILKKMLMLSWGLSLVLSLPTLWSETKIASKVGCYILACVTFILFIVTYALIGWKIKDSKRVLRLQVKDMPAKASNNTTDQSEHSGSNKLKNIKFRKHYLVPALIILTFFLFYEVPYHIQLFYITRVKFNKNVHVLIEALWLLAPVGCISDALVYIFLTKTNRDLLAAQLCRQWCARRHLLNAPGRVKKDTVVSVL